ncbi:putative membrane protein [Neorhizobium sp. R1-B]|nr:putative membrane protein [Neorhizobium sp. S3-V5DH]TDX73776.1 putative membrane protein [Neorhizobium sp. R1-B]
MSKKSPKTYLRSLFSAPALFAMAAAGAPLLAAGAAHADFRVCNSTQNLVGVAIGYRATEGWTTEGWWQVPASTCATLIEGELQSRYYYLYAEDAARGGRWTGNVNMCVAENEFKIVGVNDCFARGFQRMGFKEYDTGRQGSWMVQLSDTPGTQEGQN